MRQGIIIRFIVALLVLFLSTTLSIAQGYKTPSTDKDDKNTWPRQLTDEEIDRLQEVDAARMLKEAAAAGMSDRTTYNVGSIPFNESVSASGGRVYSIPIATAAGWKLVPNVSLTYNSQAGDGVAGYGWDIAGLPCIRIRNKGIYYDDTPLAADYDATGQVYSMDGIPLVQSDMGLGGYELASALGKVQFKPYYANSRVKYFSALYPDGSTATFGFPDSTGPHTSYPLTLLTDIDGNTISISYESEGDVYYVTEINYGTNAKLSFTYTYNYAHTPYRFSVAGLLTDYPTRLLSSITSYDGSTTICKYTLTQDRLDGINFLKQIDCSSGLGNLPPLQFTYTIDTETSSPEPVFNYVSQVVYSSPDFVHFEKSPSMPLQYHRGRFVAGNMNDGIVILPTYSTYTSVGSLFIPSATKWDSAYSPSQQILCNFIDANGQPVQRIILAEAGFQLIEAVDVDGDGIDELVKINNGSSTTGVTYYNITVYSFDSSFNYTFSTFTVQVNDCTPDVYYKNPARSYYRFGNFRGDGRAMLLIMTRESGKFALVDLNAGTKLSETTLFAIDDDEDNMVVAADFENDGKTDLCHITDTGMKEYRLSSATSTSFSYVRTLSGISPSLLYTDPFYTQGGVARELKGRIYVMDTNGDGYLDVAAAPGLNFDNGIQSLYTPTWNFSRFDGKQFYTEREILDFHKKDDLVVFLDADKDGLPDMLHLKDSTLFFLPNKNGQMSIVSENTGLQLSSTSDIIPGYPHCMDGTLGDVLVIAGERLKLYEFNIDQGARRSLIRMTDSHGIIHSNYYSRPGEGVSYQENPGRSYDWSSGFSRCRIPISYLYASMRSKDGQAFSNEFYSYWDAIIHHRGLGFCGFGQIRSRDYVNVLYTTSVLLPEKFGAVSEVRYSKSLNGTPFATTENTWDNNTTTYGKLNPRLTSSTSNNTLTNVNSTTTYTYGSYDFPVSIVTSSRIGTGTYKSSTLNRTYQHSVTASSYVLGVVSEESTLKGNTSYGAILWMDKSVFTYDSAFHPVSRQRYVGHAYRLIEDGNLVSSTQWQYDSHGNVLSEKTAPYGATEYTGSTFTYDSNGRYLLTETDALGHTTTYSSYNKWGKPATVKDYRQRTTSYTYDYWGNVTQVSRPGSLTEQTAASWGGKGLYTVTRTATGRPQTITHYDALDREVRSAVKRFDGQWQFTDRKYDSRGLLSQESLPFRDTVAHYWNSYSYDSYNRILSLTEASGRTSTWSYSGTSVTTVKDGITSTRTADALGRVVQVTDSGGTITYALRDDGQPYQITAPGGVITSISYDEYGRRASITDPSAGTQSFSYQWNSDGSSVVTHTDSNGSVTTSRDKYGRLTSVARQGEFTTTYSYNTYGLLSSISSTNGTGTQYTYDSVDRVSSEKETVPDGKWLKKAYTYTSGNVLSSTQYSSQSGSIVTESYTYANGHQTGVTIPGSNVIWSLVSENDMGMPTQVTTGTVTRLYGYTDFGMPTYRKMNGGALQDFRYQFDALKGNLTSRSDAVNNLTEGFIYDSLNRLTGMGTRAVTYAANGNITGMGGVGSMTYGNSSKPYQITALSPESSGLVPDRQQSITYTCFSRPASISEGGRTAAFTYNWNDERVKMQEADSTGTICTRHYIGGRYEVETTGSMVKQMLYLGGDAYSAPMVYIKTGSGSWTLYNIGRDYLGSITHIATKTGTLVAEYSYDPWGRLRNPSTHALYAPGTEPSLFLGRGYTGHEHLTWFGLVNMNARLYDPLLGRFLSPDPFVQAPDFTQSFNRYSYALNNPLKYTDPNGKFLVIDSFLVGLISGGFERAKQMAWNDIKIWGGLFTTDENNSFWSGVGEFLSRFTWQLPQTVIGFLSAHTVNTFRVAGGIEYVDYLHGATVLKTSDGTWGAYTISNYVVGDNSIQARDDNPLFQHEFGHYLQSQEHGLLWIFTYGIESIVSAINNDYDNHNLYYTEQDANARSIQYLYKYYGPYYAEKSWNFESNPIKNYDATKSLTENMPVIEKSIYSLFNDINIEVNLRKDNAVDDFRELLSTSLQPEIKMNLVL